jgi:predicted negative regulator of RcsB-dependent stress response
MKRAWRTFWLVGCAVLAVSSASACSSSESPAEPPPVLDAKAWLEEVEHAHVTADTGSAAQASAALNEALALPVSHEVSAMHRRVVHQDLLFRLSRAAIDAGHLEDALAAADRGLALGEQSDVFTANLQLARGEALEALGRATEAASAYFEALEINRKLLHHVLGARDAGPP